MRYYINVICILEKDLRGVCIGFYRVCVQQSICTQSFYKNYIIRFRSLVFVLVDLFNYIVIDTPNDKYFHCPPLQWFITFGHCFWPTIKSRLFSIDKLFFNSRFCKNYFSVLFIIYQLYTIPSFNYFFAKKIFRKKWWVQKKINRHNVLVLKEKKNQNKIKESKTERQTEICWHLSTELYTYIITCICYTLRCIRLALLCYTFPRHEYRVYT